MNLRDMMMAKRICAGGSGAVNESLLTNGSVGLKYKINDDYASFMTTGECTDTDVVIGSMVLGRPVTSWILASLEGANHSEVKNLIIPDSITTISQKVLTHFTSIESITLPKTSEQSFNMFFKGTTSGGSVTAPNTLRTVVITNGTEPYSFNYFTFLTKVVLPGSVVEVSAGAFTSCKAMEVIDFTACTVVPTLASTRAFKGIPSTCEIRVPAALYDEWIVATNWETYASQIVAV